MHIFSPCHQPRGVIEEHCLFHTMGLNLFSHRLHFKASFPHEPIQSAFSGRFFTDKLFAPSFIEKASFIHELIQFAFSICLFEKRFPYKALIKKVSFPHELIHRVFFNSSYH